MSDDSDASPDHADPERAGQLHHLELSTSDLEAARAFWDWLLGELGYSPKDEWAGGRSWERGPTYVVVVEKAAGDQAFEQTAPGLDHVAFHAGSRDTVDTVAAGVRERDDATLLYEDQHPYAGGYYATYARSPDGIKVEVVGPETRVGSDGSKTPN